MKRVLLFFAPLCFVLLAISVKAQDHGDDVAAAIAALPAIMQKVPSGPVSFSYWRNEDANLAGRLGAALGKPIVHESTKMKCKKDKAGADVCALREKTSLVNFSGVRIAGDFAKVFFNVEVPSLSTASPVENTSYVVDLKRSGTAWTVLRVKLLSMS